MKTVPHETIEYADVLNAGHIYVYQHMGNDLSIVNAARVSYGKHKEMMDESDTGLIRYLMRHRHGTPFEHNAITFVVKAPIFVFREWHRHRIASINEQSARYVKMTPEWYAPDRDQVRAQHGKPGDYNFERIENDEDAEEIRDVIEVQCAEAYQQYEQLLEDGIAKEVARSILPVGMYSEMWWTVNLRAALNFLSLRNADNAQWEIRQYAIEMERMLRLYFPVAMEAFVMNERIAP